MAHSAADHVLLFGMIAVQVQVITPEQLMAGLKAWLDQKQRKLSDILVDQGALDTSQVAAIDTLVAARVIRDGDAAVSLASCGGYESFRDRLEALADEDIAATLAMTGTATSTRPVFPADGAQDGDKVGSPHRFQPIRFHDEGGLGRVYEAQDRELNRNVALKEIKELFADDIESRQRFVMEAEITGRLEHPGIVPVYGLGHYDDGRPYYAMRFIHGDSFRDAIKRYHESEASHRRPHNSFELRKLLNRFLDVCQAIHYAHRRGILHRDIKPSNIMLGEYGETLVVDWGLAKPIGQRETLASTRVEHEDALLPISGSTMAPTLVGRAIGSPPYMSPEQARGEHDHLGPATDIYSLGATLHTLLTNRIPVSGASSEEILREVRRGNITPPRQINPRVPGPLNAICLKAMSAESAERYMSVDQLSDDVERYLADEPVSAYDEPWRERLFRFGRRHKGLAQTAMMGLLVIATISLGNALRLQLQASAIDARRARTARARAEFTEVLLSSSSKPSDKSPNEIAALDAKVMSIAQQLSDDPLAEADFVEGIAASFLIQGIYEPAERWAKRAYELQAQEFGEDAEETMLARLLYARTLNARGEYHDALDLFAQIRSDFIKQRGLEDRLTLSATNNLATVNRNLGRFDDAKRILAELAELRERLLGPFDEETLNTRNNLAMTLRDLGRHEEALNMLQPILKHRLQDPGKEHPSTLQSMNNVAHVLAELGKREQAIELLKETLDARKKVLGQRHPDTLTTMQNLAAAYALNQQWEEARKLYQQVTNERSIVLGENHPHTLFAKLGLAKSTYRAQGVAGTAPMFQQIFMGWKRVYGITDRRTVDAARRFCLASIEETSFDQLEPVCLQLIESLAPGSKDRAKFQVILAEVRLGLENLDESAQAAQQAIDALAAHKNSDAEIAAAQSVLGQVSFVRGNPQQALKWFNFAAENFERDPPKSYEAFREKANLRRIRAAQSVP